MTSVEKDLVEKIKKGDRDAFKVLYLKYADLLFSFIIHSLNSNKDKGADIWQETWVIAVEKIDDFHFKSSFFTWLCSIAKNKIYDSYRQAKRKDTIINSEKVLFDIDSEEIDNELIEEEVKENVIKVLANLSGEYTYLLKAKYIENRSTDEIAKVIGKSYKATESMLTRARDAFRKEFRQTNHF
jgi:RNA polymerase sigma-70 factor, ECF subfamily